MRATTSARSGELGGGAGERVLQQRVHLGGTFDQRDLGAGRRQQERVAAKARRGIDDRGNAILLDAGSPDQRMAAFAAAAKAVADGAAGKIDTRLFGFVSHR